MSLQYRCNDCEKYIDEDNISTVGMGGANCPECDSPLHQEKKPRYIM